MSSGNKGQGSSSSAPNQTTPPRGLRPNRFRTTSPVVAAGSPNMPHIDSPVATGSPTRPVTRPVVAGSPSGLSSLLVFPGPQTSPLMRQGGPTGGSTGSGFQGPFGISGLPGAMPVPVGGGAGGDRLLGIGAMGSGSPAAKKRGLDGGSSGPGGSEQHRCTLCTKTFGSMKALFGHLKSHPERGYKGAHPPPTFNAQEEFRDFPGVNLPGVVQDEGQAAAEDAQEVEVAQAGVVEEEGREEEVQLVVGPPKPFKVPNLNDSPTGSDE